MILMFNHVMIIYLAFFPYDSCCFCDFKSAKVAKRLGFRPRPDGPYPDILAGRRRIQVSLPVASPHPRPEILAKQY